MKPDCRRVLSQIASYSVEELSAEDIDAFTRHLDDCPPCKGHWVLFEKTLTTLSQVDETDISVHQSQQMWLTCLEHAKKKAPALQDAQAQTQSHSEVEVLPHPFRSDSSQREGDRRGFTRRIARGNTPTDSARVGNFGWLQSLKAALQPSLQPSWGLALAGASALVLAASLLTSPDATPSTSTAASTVALSPLPPMSQTAQFVAFETPPRATTGLIDYHSAMAFEPFSDHVAPTLVSHTATQP